MQMSKKLREADDNKAQPGQVAINYQGQAKDIQDNAPKEFFTKVDGNLFEKPSFSQFIAMMDNFNRKTGSTEPRVSPKQEKNEEVSGLHNWIRFYLLERNRTEDLDYKGYVVQRGSVMAALRFTWQGALKRSGSLLIGTSPEYDMALYTLCFLSRRGKELCQVELDGCPLSVTSYELVQNNEVYIGTVFPTAGKKTTSCGKV
ncbi:hypothetical protein Y032_0053g2321 [Ancylostoma ceylanicum]|uniref:EndoU domain-containing protein n=2 Tax=Ancylostoma ceylanicum TaxID=53326 RepID=A0A016U898_9BILA|nr:hypothetical protein Y032_0053g2321 [Ancylostoma ceylanicum]